MCRRFILASELGLIWELGRLDLVLVMMAQPVLDSDQEGQVAFRLDDRIQME